MAWDRRTKEFKKNRQHRLDHPAQAGELISDEDQIIEATTKNVIPDECIWCDFHLDVPRAVCPHCKNCQACGMHQPQGGLDMCYLCGNRVPENKILETVPSFQRIRGQRGLQRKARQDARFGASRGRKRKA